MVNIFTYSHRLDSFDIIVRTGDKNNVKLNNELPYINSLGINRHQKGEPKTQYHQRFLLQPNTYTISLELKPLVENLIDKDLSLFIRIGSYQECTFETLNVKTKDVAKTNNLLSKKAYFCKMNQLVLFFVSLFVYYVLNQC